MKFIAKFILTIIGTLVFILFVLSINVRCQFLSYRFWAESLEKGGAYSKISQVIGSRLESRVQAEGGNINDLTVLKSLISPLSVKDFFEKNTFSFLAYANAKSSEIFVYLPAINQKGGVLEKMTLQSFLQDFDIAPIPAKDLKLISMLGTGSWLLSFATLALIVLISTLIYLLIKPGKRLGGLGTIFILPGAILIGLYFFVGYVIQVLVLSFAESANIGISLAASAAPPLVLGITRLWLWAGIVLTILGLLLFFIKKPVYNEGAK